MLGKIFTVCMLVVVSACLVRPQTASKPKLAGIADDVAALLSKWGAKSTDEAVAKLWAKGDELSKAEQDDLVKLLKSSDGMTALAALQQPVTSKLAKLDNMLAEYKLGLAPEKYRQAMLADMNKMVAEITAEAAKYKKFTHTIILQHHIPRIQYPARQVLEMANIEGLAQVKHLYLVGTADEIVAANLLVRNFDNLAFFISSSILTLKPDNLLAFKKVLTRGSLEKDVFPLYNALIKSGRSNGTALTENVARKIRTLNMSSSNDLVRDLRSIKLNLDLLVRGLRNRKILLEKAGISKGHAAGINRGSLRFLKVRA